MSKTIWINGRFVEREDAHLSAFDAGLQHGVGLFETMLAVGDRIVRLDRHLKRLQTSAKELGLSDSLRAEPLAQAVRETTKRAGLDRARLRLTITGGDLNMLASTGASPMDPTILIVAQPATLRPREMFEQGVAVTVADARLNPFDPFAGHKTLHYWPRLRALQQAAAKGAGETLFFQISNHLAGGAVSNVFLVRDGALQTPIARGEEEQAALPSPVLPGVTREFVIELAQGAGVGCVRKMLTIDDLLDADEVFLTNASWGVLPVVRVEARAIGDGSPGVLTRSLRDRWLEAIGETCG